MATIVTKIVDPSVDTTGITYAVDYISLNAWQAGEQGDLVTANEVAIADCRSWDGTVDTTPVSVSGWTTGNGNYVKIWTDPNEGYRHNGIVGGNANAYTISVTSGASIIKLNEDHTIIEGLSITGGAPWYYGVGNSYNTNANHCIIRNNLFYDWGSSTNTNWSPAISINGSDGRSTSAQVYNNIVIAKSTIADAGSSGIYLDIAYEINHCYNNTVIGFSGNNSGIKTGNPNSGGGVYCYNNIAMNNGTDFSFGTPTSGFILNDYNLSSDATATGTNSLPSKVASNQFVDLTAGSEDLHLKTGADAIGAGKVAFGVYSDIDNDLRTSYDIGADEFSTSRPSAGGASWLSGYNARKRILIDADTYISSDQTNFPVAVRIGVTETAFWAKTLASGSHIRFTSSDGTTLLNFEVENFDSVNNEAWWHVKVPTLSSSADTEIYLYYDADTPSDGSNATGVWDSNFKGVYHLSNNANDSTSNNHDGTINSAPYHTSGVMSRGLYFDGVNDIVDLDDEPEWELNRGHDVTISYWVQGHSGRGISKYDEYQIFTQGKPMGYARFGGSDQWWSGSGGSNNSEWHHNTVVFKPSVPSITVYQDGVSLGTDTLSGSPSSGNYSLLLGARRFTDFCFLGVLDEVRISNNSRSLDWGIAEYESGRVQWLGIGSEETPGGSQDADYTANTQTLALAQHGATVAAEQNANVVAGAQALGLTQYPATVTADQNADYTAASQSLGLTQYPASVTTTAGVSVTANTLPLNLAQYSATVTAEQNITVSPAAQNLTLAQHSASVTTTAGVGVVANSLPLNLTQHSAAVTIEQDATVTASSQSLGLTQHSATVTMGELVSVNSQSLNLTQHSASVSITTSTTVTVGSQLLSLTQYGATVSVQWDADVPVNTQALVFAQHAPSVSTAAVQGLLQVEYESKSHVATYIGHNQG